MDLYIKKLHVSRETFFPQLNNTISKTPFKNKVQKNGRKD